MMIGDGDNQSSIGCSEQPPQMHRRDVLKSAAVVVATTIPSPAVAKESSDGHPPLIDTNVSLFRWPFRRLPLDRTEVLVDKLRALGVGQAWAGSFEGIFHRDLASANGRLFEECRPYPELLPVGSINPTLPGWQRDLDQCLSKSRMFAIRLHPGYHGYDLSDESFRELLQRTAKAGCLVQIVVTVEDPRTQSVLVRVEDIDLAPLPDLVSSIEGCRVQLLNHRLRPSELVPWKQLNNVFFDTARVEQTDGVATLLRAVGASRVMLGTHAPFLIPEAALVRCCESELSDAEMRSVLADSATHLRDELLRRG